MDPCVGGSVWSRPRPLLPLFSCRFSASRPQVARAPGAAMFRFSGHRSECPRIGACCLYYYICCGSQVVVLCGVYMDGQDEGDGVLSEPLIALMYVMGVGIGGGVWVA